MSVFSPATADLIDRLTRYRDRLAASGRERAAAIVDAAIAEVRAEAAGERRRREARVADPQ